MKNFDRSELERLIKGDKEVFRDLFEMLYIPMVQRSAFFLHDIHAAEDIVQDVFARLWSGRHRLKGIGNIESYIYRWVRNDTLNYMQRTSMAEKYHQIYLGAESTLPEADPEPYILALTALLEKLPEKRRQILKMSIFESKSYMEIASELDISVNTVKDHIKKAYNFLRQESDSIPYP